MTFTIWVQEADGTGTIHVSAHDAETPEEAAIDALLETQDDWGGEDCYSLHNLAVLGIAKGSVDLVEWNDLAN